MTAPGQPGGVQALDRERERIIALLSRSFAADHLSLEELETRLELAYRAGSTAEVRALVSDLPEAPAADGSLTLRPAATPSQAVHARMVSIMSSRTRGGVWIPPQVLNVVAVMSDTHLDLREAQFSAGITEICVKATMASVRITVPPGVHVVTETSPFMGSVSDRSSRGPKPPRGAPVLKVTGWAVMSEVLVRRRDLDD